MTRWIRLPCALAVLAAAGLLHATEARAVRDEAAAEKRVADIMAIREKALLAIVPTNCPDVTCACPKCGTNLGKWTPKKPFEIQCTKCKTVYPNKAYPMDRTQVFLNFIGEEVAVPCHLGPKPKSNPSGQPHPERYFLNAPIDNKRYGWLSGRVITDLVRAYKATGKQAYARRAALVLDGFARNYKHYLVHRGRGRCYYARRRRRWQYRSSPARTAGGRLAVWSRPISGRTTWSARSAVGVSPRRRRHRLPEARAPRSLPRRVRHGPPPTL